MSNVGFVYLLEHKDTDKIYVGSTKQTIQQRVYDHTKHYKRNHSYCTSYELIKYGDDGLNWIELEKVEYDDEEDLRKAERYWFDIYKEEFGELLINEKLPFRSNDEKIKYCNDMNRKWYGENKKKIQAQRKQHRENNRDKINAKKREPVLCECGFYSTSSHISRHRRTKKHFELMAEKLKEDSE